MHHFFEKFSVMSLQMLIRFIAHGLRFVLNLRRKKANNELIDIKIIWSKKCIKQRKLRQGRTKIWGAFLWSKSKSGFRTLKWLSVPLNKSKKVISNQLNPLWGRINRFNPIRLFLDLKSKRSIGNGFEKSTTGQRGLANNIVPSLLSFFHNSVTSRVFAVINPSFRFSIPLKTATPKNPWCQILFWIRPKKHTPRLEDRKFDQVKDSLSLFTDEKGILRFGGRLKSAPISYGARYPIFLPRCSPFTRLVISECHHNGARNELTELISKSWVTKGLQAVKNVTGKRYIWKKIEDISYAVPSSSALPEFRLSDEFACTRGGVDFHRPMYVKKGEINTCTTTRTQRRDGHVQSAVVRVQSKNFRLRQNGDASCKGCIHWKWILKPDDPAQHAANIPLRVVKVEGIPIVDVNAC